MSIQQNFLAICKNRMTKSIIILLTVFVFASCSKQKKYTNVVYLKKDSIEIGILPEVGGRLVSLKLNNGDNFLISDTSLWHEELATLNAPSEIRNKKTYFGHINWVGPQSQWWINQDVYTDLRDQKSWWPPDPFLIYGNYEIEKKRKSYIKLKGPESAYSRIRFDKEYNISDDNSILLKASAINTSDKKVSWDIWFNTRNYGLNKCYVPAKKENCRFWVMTESENDSLEYNYEQGYFYFNRDSFTTPGIKLQTKALIYPEDGYMAVFSKNEMLLVQFERYNKEQVHPEQGMVEIYNQISSNEKDCLLEVEYHSPYETINPGESISSQIKWKLFSYKGENSTDAHITFLKKTWNNTEQL